MKVVVLSLLVSYVAYASAKECVSMCTMEYRPVCGGPKGGPYATFGNECEYNYANCENNDAFEISSQGVCAKECQKGCTRIYEPICAGPKGGPYTTYSNQCVFDVQNCQKHFQEYVDHAGAC